TGVDLSVSMIEEDKFKANKEGLDLSFLSQDMRDLKLGSEQFTTVISACDVLNYLTCPKDLSTAFNQVRQVLEPGGFWLFDLNSAHKLQEIYGDQSYADLQEDYGYFWDNSYDWAQENCHRVCIIVLTTLPTIYE